MSNEYEKAIRENFIAENQTMNTSHKHFPTSLIIDKEIKISATSTLVNLLPENLDSVPNNLQQNISQNDIKIDRPSRLRLWMPGKKKTHNSMS